MHNNWIQEWALFEDVATGIKMTLEGKTLCMYFDASKNMGIVLISLVGP